ncbi:MAG TPA: LPS export ABC transporter permease LptG [Wenzhouxiangella sp.]
MNIIHRYVMRNVFAAYWVTGLGMGALFWVLDLLDRLESGVGGVLGLLQVAMASFMGLPETLIDLLPVITVLATALAMGRLQTLSELSIMRVSGLSIWRLAGMAMAPGLLIVALGLATLQWAVPLLHQQPERAVGASLGENGLWHPIHGLWIRQGNQFLNVEDLELGRFPVGINVFKYADGGGLVEHTTAQRGLVAADGQWILSNVTRTLYEPSYEQTQTSELIWDSFLTGRQLALLLNPPASLSLTDLWQYVAGLKQRAQPHAEFELLLWERLSLPLACLAMILAAMATAAVPLKSRVIGVRIVGALILGLGFELITEMVAYLGLLLGWPIPWVAVGPPILLSVLSVWLVAKAR